MRLHLRAASRLSLAAAIIAIGSLAAAPAAHGLSSKPARTVVTNGAVNAVAPTAKAIYLGGSFTQVGPRTGPGVGIDSTTGKNEGLPQVGGGYQEVDAVVRDGSGGFFIGGSFTRVGATARQNLAHILADGSVDPSFKPNPDGGVYALAVSGSTVYAGGHFTAIGGQSLQDIAALDRTTGQATSWDPNPGPYSYVYALAVSGQTVYVGGAFTQIGGQARKDIVALDRTTGQATSWDPNPDSCCVNALAVSGQTVYAGGDFNSIGGKARSSIAALDATTGAATSWNPDAGCARGVCQPSVDALRVSGSTIYAGGGFNRIGGQARNNIAALDATTGAATSWNPHPNQGIDALAVSGSTVYAGGYFTAIGGQARNNIAALSRSTGQATSWNPHPNESVHALAVSGSTVYAGGYFTSIGSKTRHGLAALGPTTGALKGWNPNATRSLGDAGVDSLAAAGSTVYAGGLFDRVGGKARNNIAALDATTGAAKSWNPNAGATVRALRVSGPIVYAGGNFDSIGGKARNNIAALSRATGGATSWNPNANNDVDALAVSGQTVYAGGFFEDIGGKARGCIAALTATSGVATSWNPAAGCYDSPHSPFVSVLRVSGPTVYAGGDFNSIGGKARSSIAALDATTGAATSWNPDAVGGDEDFASVRALLVSGSTVYAGGGFYQIGGQARNGLAALDAATGAATSWNPDANGRVGVLAFGSDGSLWAGGGFKGFGAVPQSGIARFKP